MFDYMTKSQFASLIIGIIFSIIAIATTCLVVKYSKKFNSFGKTIFAALIAPYIACTAWLFLCFSFIEGLRKDDVLNLVISLILSLFIFGMVVIVAKALYNKHGVDETEEKEEKVEEEAPASEAPAQKPLLLEHKAEEKEVEEVSSVEDEPLNEVAENEEIEVEEESQNEEEFEKVAEEVTEETVEEEQEEPTNDKEESLNVANYEPQSEDEVEEDSDEAEESEEAIEEEQEETTDSDKEFEEFIESLKKKIENENKDEDDNQ